MKLLIGAHVSIAGGLYKAFERSTAIGGTVMQIFTKSSRSWYQKPLSKEDIALFAQHWQRSGIADVVVHNTYLVNIAAADAQLEKKSVEALKDELHRCEQLNIPYLVMHPGSHGGFGEEQGLKKIAKNLDIILGTAEGNTKIVLETTAGQGTALGTSFEQIAAIRSWCKEKKRIGVCIDTCHIFSAGYDIASEEGYEKTMKQCDNIIGLSHVKVMHINDSKTPLGSHVDRHENLGKGTIPLKTFERMVNDKRLAQVPKILETPDEDLYAKEIAMLNKMVHKYKSG
jgi:deoxyribonuclease-4